MKKNKFQIVKLISTSLAISIIALAGAIGLHMAIAAWQGPTADPPSSNVSAPVNVGTTTQVKTGELELQGGLKIHNSGQPTAKLYTDTSGLYIDAQNDGDSNLISTESYLYLRGKILDIADDTVNIGEKLSVDGDINMNNNKLIISGGDGLEIGRNDSYCSSNDCYYIAKTDGNSGDPDGKLLIGNRGNDGNFEEAIRVEGNNNVVFGGGSGKITVGTIDPLYNIAGGKYATYMAAMTGVKEETTGNVNLENCVEQYCFSVINFTRQEKGNDLWLFYQTTDFGSDWKNLVVLLTPEGRGEVWYEINPEEKQLIIYGEKEGRVSYRLTAPRFDYTKWPNKSTEEEIQGIQLNSK